MATETITSLPRKGYDFHPRKLKRPMQVFTIALALSAVVNSQASGAKALFEPLGSAIVSLTAPSPVEQATAGVGTTIPPGTKFYSNGKEVKQTSPK